MIPLLRHRATVIWLVLVLATLVSWFLGTDHGFGSDHRPESVLIMVVAFVKVRLVGLHFMELRNAPAPLRLLFEIYVVVVLALIIGLYLAG
jgi:hypothetical protein